ncbi:MAG: hypothetical protein ACE5FT_05780 [Candidatus Nanoarchaeia archaeon]
MSNNPPQLDVNKDITVNEGDTINLNAKCWDPDEDETTITISGWMTEQTKKLDFGDAGDYGVHVECTDGEDTVKADVSIKVNNKNRPPTIGWKRV